MKKRIILVAVVMAVLLLVGCGFEDTLGVKTQSLDPTRGGGGGILVSDNATTLRGRCTWEGGRSTSHSCTAGSCVQMPPANGPLQILSKSAGTQCPWGSVRCEKSLKSAKAVCKRTGGTWSGYGS